MLGARMTVFRNHILTFIFEAGCAAVADREGSKAKEVILRYCGMLWGYAMTASAAPIPIEGLTTPAHIFTQMACNQYAQCMFGILLQLLLLAFPSIEHPLPL